MGLDTNGVRFLLESLRKGVDFHTTAMLGRQGLHLDRREFGAVFRRCGLELNSTLLDDLWRNGTRDDGYADALLRYCGASTLLQIDYSTFEGASFAHDMNREIPREHWNRYTCIIDGGTLEHVYNFPVAISNCMKMLRVGGHFLAVTPCNNSMGHGFYQFSPELFWSLFSEDNGFVVDEMFLFESEAHAVWYAVANPAVLRRRVDLRNARQSYLLVRAHKTMSRDVINPPQQSDYIELWKTEDGGSVRSGMARVHRLANVASSILPRRVKRAMRNGIDLFRDPFAKPLYVRYK